MSEIILACRTCGNEFVLPEDVSLLSCPACGTQHSRPRAKDTSLDCLRRAHQQRVACDFTNAEQSYQRVLLEYPDEAEALWGLTLCKYGVEYVEDSKTHERLPVVHFMRRRPIIEDSDYTLACARADEAVRAQYRADAAYITRIQQGVLNPAVPPESYDVFLCYKATLPGSGERTREFEHARDLYYTLREGGYRIFFAHETLKQVAGANYEAQIYHALHSAKVMLVVTSEPEYLNTSWVRSEWSRYLERIDGGDACRLIPLLYDGCDPYALPDSFIARGIQALRMDELTSLDSLRGTLAKVVGPRLDLNNLSDKASAVGKQTMAVLADWGSRAKSFAQKQAENAAVRSEAAAKARAEARERAEARARERAALKAQQQAFPPPQDVSAPQKQPAQQPFQPDLPGVDIPSVGFETVEAKPLDFQTVDVPPVSTEPASGKPTFTVPAQLKPLADKTGKLVNSTMDFVKGTDRENSLARSLSADASLIWRAPLALVLAMLIGLLVGADFVFIHILVFVAVLVATAFIKPSGKSKSPEQGTPPGAPQ